MQYVWIISCFGTALLAISSPINLSTDSYPAFDNDYLYNPASTVHQEQAINSLASKGEPAFDDDGQYVSELLPNDDSEEQETPENNLKKECDRRVVSTSDHQTGCVPVGVYWFERMKFLDYFITLIPLSKLFLEEINEKVGPIPPPSPATQHKAYAQLLHAFQDELKREAAAAAHRPESQPPPAIQNGSSPPTNQPQPEPQPVDYATVLKSFNQDWLKGTVESVMVTLGVPLKGEELATAAEATIATMELLALKV